MKKVLLMAVIVMAGCASRQPMAPQTFDFGMAPAPAQPAHSLQVNEVRAPEWLDSSQMHYRLAYKDPRVLAPYSTNRWAGPPASLLTVRLRQELGNLPGGRCTLSANILEFSQVFDAADSSRAVLQLHAVLSAGRSADTRAQREFRLEAKAATPDAAGGAAAFSGLASELARSLNTWISETGFCASP